jgi:hypothetical protein
LAPGVDPCFTIQGSFIENLVGTAFTDDQLIGNELKNQITSGDGGSWDPIFTGQICAVEFLDGRESADTYKGYAPGGQANGVDLIRDTGGSTNIDKLVLTKLNLNEASFFQQAGTAGSDNIDSLIIVLPDNELIYLWTYFQGTSTDACANASGTGLIEKISFADASNVDFAQVKDLLGCSTAGSVQGTTQEWPQLQSFTPPESSNGTNTVTPNSQR